MQIALIIGIYAVAICLIVLIPLVFVLVFHTIPHWIKELIEKTGRR